MRNKAFVRTPHAFRPSLRSPKDLQRERERVLTERDIIIVNSPSTIKVCCWNGHLVAEPSNFSLAVSAMKTGF